jgi:purine-cytosine permease-like protein
MDQRITMKANTKWTIAALVALAAATVHTLHAQAIGPMSAHDSDAAGLVPKPMPIGRAP